MSVPPLRVPFLTEEAARSLSRSLEEPDWLLEQRLDAERLVRELPAESNQLFTPYLDLRAARFAEIQPYAVTGFAPGSGTAPLDGASALLHVQEDTIVARVLGPEAAAAGVFLGTFAEALRDRPDVLRDLIGSGDSLPADDAFAQVARAGFALGILLHVPSGVTLADPIVLRWSMGAAGRGLLTRTVISIGDDAHVNLLQDEEPTASEAASAAGGAAPTASGAAPTATGAAPAGQSLWWGTAELRLGDDASLDVSGIQDFGPATLAVINRHASLGREAHLRWSMASVGALLHRSRIDNRLVGRGSTVHQVEIAFGAGSQLFDLTSYTRHLGADTTGNLLSKGVFLDRSRGYMKGLIEIQRSAKGADSFLGEFSMLLDRKARSVTIPSLEIDQPDVRRAAHSSSAGPIDETQVFYLMSRGLDREIARKFIVMGFLEPVVARVPLAEAQDRLRGLLEAKWPAASSGGRAAEASAA